MRCFVLWRGTFALPSAAALKVLRLSTSLAENPPALS
jgi:hypothetical protein